MDNAADIISTLLAHGMILGRGASKVSASGSSSNMVIAAQTPKGCTNLNCKAKKWSTHTTDNCYWPGGGKEGQFPPNFGQRAKANITMSTTVATPTPSTNTLAPVKTEHFVLSAWDSATRQSGVLIDCYISFLLSSFYWLSWHSDSAPDVTSLCTDYSSTCYTFILISGFKCFSIVPNFYMHSRLPFHMLSPFLPCAQTLFMTFSELLWHFIFLWLSFIMLPTYPDAAYKPMYLLISSSVCKLTLIPLLSYLLSKSPLSSKVSLFSLIALLVLW